LALLKQIATVAGGSAAGQLVVLATTPWLARVYSPSAFGEYAAFLSLCGVFLTTACFRYDVALNATSDEYVAPVFWTACLAAPVMAVLAALISVSPWGSALLHRVVGPQASIWRIAAAAVVCGLFQATAALAIRDGRFAYSSLIRMAQPALFSTAALLLPAGLIDSCLIGYLVALPLTVAYGTRLPWSGFEKIARTARQLREFPVVSLPTSLLDALSLAMPVWFISSRYSSLDAGNYAQVQRLLAAPLTLMAIAIGQVYIKRAGDIVRAKQSPRAFQRRVVKFLALGAGLLLLAVYLLGSPVLRLFLGHAWRTDTAFLVLVFLPVAVRCCVSPVTGIFIVRNRLRIGAFWQVLYFCITGAVFFSLAGRVPLEKLLIAFAISETVCYGIYIYIADQVAG
jgi:O-antigen/teichoic acid export membrane protein